MIIEIEAYTGDCYLLGRTMNYPELKMHVNRIFHEVAEDDFVSIFCARFDFEKVNCSDSDYPDYVIDLDAHRIYEPHK